MTYFWNGNRGAKFDETLEVWEEIPSDQVPFDQKPAMKCREITQKLIGAMQSGQYSFLRCNFPNGDMVGHTGNLEAVIASMEALDTCLGQIVESAGQLGYTLLITADHGNADPDVRHAEGWLRACPYGALPHPCRHPLRRRRTAAGCRFPALANVAPPSPRCWVSRLRKVGMRV